MFLCYIFFGDYYMNEYKNFSYYFDQIMEYIDYKEWLEDNLNVYSSFFFEEKGTNKSAHFFKKSDGTVERC